MCDLLALVPQASKKHLAKKPLRDPLDTLKKIGAEKWKTNETNQHAPKYRTFVEFSSGPSQNEHKSD